MDKTIHKASLAKPSVRESRQRKTKGKKDKLLQTFAIIEIRIRERVGKGLAIKERKLEALLKRAEAADSIAIKT